MSARDGSPSYRAHAQQAETWRELAGNDARLEAYWRGYRAGMTHTLNDGAIADDETTTARAALAARVIAGEEPDRDAVAWGAGYYDGQRWDRPAAQRGRIRFAALRRTGGSIRRLALAVLGADDAYLRAMLRGDRPIPLAIQQQLADILHEMDGTAQD